ncbi:DUF58 domain-containing protein [Cellulomonas denverensis]|uniref:DUF58 domain-containing protein n=1 Tax=Cellulomonas denverensis TaxID=264297 RepID=A0A7X6QYZ8_9CELL|nr:DUF58 domain-containing protein [Cellulomonas denverensis]NKY22556.1 DUF58 domain-containing protein [Cellulomonas denverensis]GIG24799.1 lipoprotein [Cellulomonas denverensis]
MALTWRAVVLTAVGVVPVLLFPAPGTVLAWGLLVLALCVLDAALAASPRLVAVRREAPTGSVRLHQDSQSRLLLTHTGRRRLRALVRDAWPPSAGAEANRHLVSLPPGESTRVRTALQPTRRGTLPADRVTIRTAGPLGLAGRQVSLTVPGELRVLPEFASRRHLPSRLARLREMDGRAAVQVRGQGTEFDSLREYVVGDDVRSIDWRASARRADVVVRTWRPERDRRVLLVLDTSRTSAARVGDAPRLDAQIEAALLLAALAGRAGDRVELVAYDRVLRARVAGAAGARLMPAMAEALAGVEPALVETDWPGVVGQVTERLSRRGLVVLLSALEPAAVEAGLLGVVDQLTARHQVVLAGVRDPEVEHLRADRGDLMAAAAAERTELERSAVAALLRGRGVEVVDALPDDLAPRLADTYLALKAAGRL